MKGSDLKGIYKPYRIPLRNGMPTASIIEKYGLRDTQLLIKGTVSEDGSTISLRYKAPYRDLQRDCREFEENITLVFTRQ